MSQKQTLYLEDFGAENSHEEEPSSSIQGDENKKSGTDSVDEEQNVVDDDRLILTQAELDLIKKISFEEGKEKAEEEIKLNIEQKYNDLFYNIEKEISKFIETHNDNVEKISQIFSSTILDILEKLFSDFSSNMAFLKRNIYDDAISFIKKIEGDVFIQCHEQQKEDIRKIIQGYKNIHLEESESCHEGMIKFVTPKNIFVIEPQEWQKTVIGYVTEAIELLRKDIKE